MRLFTSKAALSAEDEAAAARLSAIASRFRPDDRPPPQSSETGQEPPQRAETPAELHEPNDEWAIAGIEK